MTEKKTLTPEERKKVEAQIADLQQALDDVDEATTPAQEAAAEAELERERAATAALFDRLGLTEEDYDLLVAALASGTEARTREIVREELGEDPPEGEGTTTVADLQTNPEGPPAKPADAPPETPPDSQHWTKRKVFGKKDELVTPDGG